MKFNLAVDLKTGIEQKVKTEDGRITVRAVYSTKSYTRVGYLRKGSISQREPRFTTRRAWTAYLNNGRQVGVFTTKNYALVELLYAVVGQTPVL